MFWIYFCVPEITIESKMLAWILMENYYKTNVLINLARKLIFTAEAERMPKILKFKGWFLFVIQTTISRSILLNPPLLDNLKKTYHFKENELPHTQFLRLEKNALTHTMLVFLDRNKNFYFIFTKFSMFT